MDVLDLDALVPEKQIVKLGGFEVDVTIVPLGITFKINDVIRKFGSVDQAAINANDEGAVNSGIDLSIDLCVAFCERQHPEMTREWFLDNCDIGRVNALAMKIREALERSYEGVPPKN